MGWVRGDPQLRRLEIERMSGPARPSIRVGFSSCLLCEKIGYEGGHKRDAHSVESFGRSVEWVPVGREVGVG
jgi:hypothetical protein